MYVNSTDGNKDRYKSMKGNEWEQWPTEFMTVQIECLDWHDE